MTPDSSSQYIFANQMGGSVRGFEDAMLLGPLITRIISITLRDLRGLQNCTQQFLGEHFVPGREPDSVICKAYTYTISPSMEDILIIVYSGDYLLLSSEFIITIM